jgi:hypothetical protein
MYTAAEKLTEVERELGYRRRVFERLVQGGDMSRSEANRRIRIMEEIRDDYATMAKVERLL